MPFGESFALTQGIFLKSLGIIYLIAFFSLLPQIQGLYGSKGIEPLKEKLDYIRLFSTKNHLIKHPSIFWLVDSDASLTISCWIGIFASLGVVLGFAIAPCLAIAWFIYLSFTSIGHPFLNFQWDVLLVETGTVSIFYALLSPAPPIFIWVYWMLIFRFMFASGFTKLVFGSKEWRDFTAMDYHYETQPLPTKTAYYLHHQPKWLSKISTGSTYFVELLVPVLIFTPESLRIYIFAILVFFQLILIVTGNFAFFNLLTIVLCIPLLSDTYLQSLSALASFTPILPDNAICWTLLTIVGSVFFFINTLALVANIYPLKKLKRILRKLSFLQSGNTYGLFVHMTTERFEITLEGSYDGLEWKEYQFRYKPGQLELAPVRIAPHQPRLDWHMWFAALGSYRQHPWFSHFIQCLFNQSPEVIKLLKNNPFPDAPPQYIRARFFRYQFTSLEEKRKTGQWWKREQVTDYAPTYRLTNSI